MDQRGQDQRGECPGLDLIVSEQRDRAVAGGDQLVVQMPGGDPGGEHRICLLVPEPGIGRGQRGDQLIDEVAGLRPGRDREAGGNDRQPVSHPGSLATAMPPARRW